MICPKQEKSVMLCEGLIEKEKFLSERGDVLNVFEWRADQAVLGKGVAQAKLSEAEYHSWGLLEEQKRSFASEAQSELDKQELRVECAHRALHEASMQLHSQRKELHQANQLSDQSQREKSWSCTELDRRARVHQEDRMMSPQETKELAKMFCTEAERATQLIIHELSIQEEESKSTVNQLMVPTSGTTKTR